MKMKLERSLRPIAMSAIALACLLLGDDRSAANAPNTDAEKLMEKQGCLHCHYLRGRGGFIGPPLEGIRRFRTEDDIIAVLTKSRPLPDSYPKDIVDASEFMKHINLSKDEAKTVASYLLTIPDEEAFEVKGHGEDEPDSVPQGFSFKPKEPSEISRRGMKVYREAGCVACHSIAGFGGWRGPSLDAVGAKLNKTAIENRISRGATVFFDGKEYKPSEYSMPPAELSPEQVSEVAEFLLTLPTKPAQGK
jgi:mono/diheme cytochrome c family protein